MAFPANHRPSWTADHSVFLDAIENKEPTETLAQLAQRIDPNAFHDHRDGDFDLLFHASIANNLNAFRILIERGANPVKKNKFGTNIMKLLIKRDQIEMAKICIDSLVEERARKDFVNQSISSGWTILMTCAEGGHLEMARLLVEKGADVNKRMATGWTASHAAAKMGHLQVLEFLLQNGADKNIRASHRQFGRDLKVEDVTADQQVIQLLSRFQ